MLTQDAFAPISRTLLMAWRRSNSDVKNPDLSVCSQRHRNTKQNLMNLRGRLLWPFATPLHTFGASSVVDGNKSLPTDDKSEQG